MKLPAVAVALNLVPTAQPKFELELYVNDFAPVPIVFEVVDVRVMSAFAPVTPVAPVAPVGPVAPVLPFVPFVPAAPFMFWSRV